MVSDAVQDEEIYFCFELRTAGGWCHPWGWIFFFCTLGENKTSHDPFCSAAACSLTPDLVEVLVFSMVDIRRAKASATRLPELPESSLAVVSSYSSGSTPDEETKVTEAEGKKTNTSTGSICKEQLSVRSKPVRVSPPRWPLTVAAKLLTDSLNFEFFCTWQKMQMWWTPYLGVNFSCKAFWQKHKHLHCLRAAFYLNWNRKELKSASDRR